MKITNHFSARMSHRGLTKKLINLVLDFGKINGDKIVLDKKESQKLLSELDRFRKDMLRIIDKGGVTVVAVDDKLITAYNTDSYKRK